MPSTIISSVDTNKKKHTGKYKDPLNKPLPVLMSYSNEIGTAISEIAPKLGAALWAPTFMYLGADIYDKYKNDKDNYNPSGKRAFKRAIFQGLTSIIALPVLIFAGQCTVSPLTKIDKWGISGNAKDAVYKHTKNVIDQAHGIALESYENFKNIIVESLENKIKTRKHEKNTSGILKKIYNKTFTHRYTLLESDKSKIIAFAEYNAKKTYNIIEALKNHDKKHVPWKIYKKYQNTIPKMNEMYKEADYSYYATRTALKDYQMSLIFKNKILKTLGGFGALILFANPVNDFVDKQIMKKFISPGIDHIYKAHINDSRIKAIFNNMNANSTSSYKNETTSNLIQKLKIQHGLTSKAGGSP